MEKKLLSLLVMLLMAITVMAQKRTITGKVISVDDGLPLTGVTIKLKGTKAGVTTNNDGKYSISGVDDNSVLVFSYIGYAQKEIKVGNLSSIDIKMEPVGNTLDDVVVVGYGTQKKKELTNAVVQVSGEEVKKSTAASLSNALSGKMAGLFVNQRSASPGFDDAKISIRGPQTYGNSSALIVIDGVASADPDGLNRLDPNDIESISVLKDASAAIYGAQSAGGVILVTTKRGTTGIPDINFNTTHVFQTPTMKVRSADALEYMNALNQRRELDGTPHDFPDVLVNAFKNGTRKSTDWWNELVDPPATQSRQSLSVRGGTDKVRYFISLGTQSQGGILRGDDKTKLLQYNARSNVDVNITSTFEVGLDLSYRQKNTHTPQDGAGSGIGQFANTIPTIEAYVDGDYRYPAEGQSQLNPVARLLGSGYKKYQTDVGSATLRFKYDMPFISGLSLDGFASFVKNYAYNKFFDYTWFYYVKDPNTGEIKQRKSREFEAPGVRKQYSQDLRSTQNIKLSYKKSIQGHKFDAFVSYEQMDYNFNGFNAGRVGYNSPIIDLLVGGSPNRNNWTNDDTESSVSRINYFGRLNYDYKGKYLLGFSARYDGSSIFPKGKRFGFFPQISAGWVLSSESFIPQNIFSNLKLRASWGELGNDRVNPFQYLTSYGYSTAWVINGADVRGIRPTTTANPNITWETSEKTDIGLEAGFLNNNLTFEFDVFQTKTKNILGKRNASIPDYTGLSLPDENIGKMDNKGFEIQAGYRHNFGGVGFRVNGNLSYVKNKVIFFDEPPQAEPYQKLEGMPFESALVYKAIGIYRTQEDLTKYTSYPSAKVGDLIFADLNGDGKVDFNDMYRLDVTSFPKLQFGATFGFNYKNFDLTFLLQGQGGAKWKMNNSFNAGPGGNGLKYIANNSFSLENRNAELPMIMPTGTGKENSDYYYHTVNWMRFKSVELGYSLPKNILSRVKILGLRVFVSGENLFMIYNNLAKYGAGDPEFLFGFGEGYPNMKNLSFGLNLTF